MPPSLIFTNLNLLINASYSADTLPSDGHEIEKLIDFIRVASGYQTRPPTTNLSNAALLVRAFLGFDLFQALPALPGLLDLVSGRINPSNPLVNWNLILSSPAWAGAPDGFLLGYVFSTLCGVDGDLYSPLWRWALDNFIISETAAILLAALMSSSGNEIDIERTWARWLPNFNLARAINLFDIFIRVLPSAWLSPNPVTSSNAKAGLFWLLADNKYPPPHSLSLPRR